MSKLEEPTNEASAMQKEISVIAEQGGGTTKVEQLIQQYCPDGVEYKRLGDVCLMERGTSATKGTMQEGDIPVISGGRQPAFYCSQSNREGETITVAGSGAGAGYVQYWDKPIFVCDAFSIKGNDSLNTKFIYYFLSSIQEKIYATKKGGGVPHVHISSIDKFEIPVPPLPVQEEIVRILDSFTELQAELQAELQKRLQQYNYYRDNLLSFEGRTDVEWKRLGDVCLKTDNIKWKSTKETYQYIDLTSVDIQTHNILSTMEIDSSSAPSRAQQIVKEDDVIFATTRPTQMRVCLVPVEYDGQICSTGYCVLRPDSSIVLPQYLFFVLAVESFKTYLLNNQTMGNYPSISNNTLKDYTIPIPSISEQRKIVGVLDRFDTLTCDLVAGLPAEIEKRRQQYEYYRDKLLTFKRKEA